MTATARQLEFSVTVQTRLGELCANRAPEQWMLDQATEKANEHVAAVELEEWKGEQKV